MQTLQEWMSAEGVKDKELSDKLGVSRVQVLRLRRRKCRPSFETAKRLEEITKLPAADFLMVEVDR